MVAATKSSRGRAQGWWSLLVAASLLLANSAHAFDAGNHSFNSKIGCHPPQPSAAERARRRCAAAAGPGRAVSPRSTRDARFSQTFVTRSAAIGRIRCTASVKPSIHPRTAIQGQPSAAESSWRPAAPTPLQHQQEVSWCRCCAKLVGRSAASQVAA